MSKTSIEWRQERAAKIAQARALVDAADGENRDFTPEERTAYDALMGEQGEIGKLTKVIGEREALETLERENAEKLSAPVKPDGKKDDQKKVMKRAEFDAMSDAKAKAEFVRTGGVVED